MTTPDRGWRNFKLIPVPCLAAFRSCSLSLVLTVRCSSRGAVLSLVVCHSMKIDDVASGVRRLSGGVTSSRRGAGCQS
ncbi:hypothetical protein TNCV_3719581 [Trichonephila clavipes]|nr:hypothetical protein TNCV_3719581 [Trichonephila clavipes]